MAAVTAPPIAVSSKRPPSLPDEPSVVLRGVSWETYERLCDEIPERMPHSYDEGVLELMSPSFQHGRYDQRVSRLLGDLTAELNIPILSAGAMTLKKKSAFKGVEPDGVFWIANESVMRDKEEFHPETDPPPDLVIETEISRTVLDRLHILASLGVPEVWRSTPEGIGVLHLHQDGSYQEVTHSLALPFLEVAELSPFLERVKEMSETEQIRRFRHWVRERFADRLPDIECRS